MAKIGIENISEIRLNVLPLERTRGAIGSLAIHPEVSAMCAKKGYDDAPKSREEADARGAKSFNGLMSSFTNIRVYTSGDQKIVVADIAPTRYLIGQALRDYAKEHPETSEDELRRMSPDMANVSLVCPVRKDGQYFLLSQIKGKALGSGEIHTGIVAGNVDARYLGRPDPLTATLQEECSEEIGLDLSYLNSSSFTFMIDERETGQVNFASVARQADINTILSAYEANAKRKLPKEQLEVMGLSLLPVDGIALVPLEKGTTGLQEIVCFHPTPEGLKEIKETRRVRPYTQATLDYIAERANVTFLLQKAGF